MAFGEAQAINGAMAVYQRNRPIETVSLSRLIDFSIQRTYHELVVLTELLPRKSDMERKIEIVTFANRTRQLFVRLLALVKWAGSASKVEKCSTIVSFLDKQSMLFIETADILAKMSRESLVQARLPSFQLPSAVEVLTSGTYTRLPACIRDKIVPPDPITAEEKKSTLLRLNQIIQQRLVTSQLPKQMRNLRIEFGRVTFHVPYEFELSLTLMGDSNTLPWRVLDLSILVEDKETGEGKDLVHYFQNTFLQHMVQAKLTENYRSLTEAYEILHSFCLSLQLEVLHAQTIRLSRERLGDFVRVEEYVPGSRLTISYWRDQTYNDGKGCKLTIEMDSSNPGDPLTASHYPDLGFKETQFANRAIKSDTLSIEKLLIYSTHERAKEILNDLRDQLQKSKESESIDFELTGSPPALSVSYVHQCMDLEKLIFSVDALTGQLLIHIPQFEQCPLLDELQVNANKDINRLVDLIRRLRIWMYKERHRKTAEFVGTQVTDSLPIVNAEQHQFLQTDDNCTNLFVMFPKYPFNCLLIKFEISDFQNQKYYLLLLEPCAKLDKSSQLNDMYTSTKALYNLSSMLELQVDCIVQQKNDAKNTDSYCEPVNGLKRKRLFEDSGTNKKTCVGSFYITKFACIIDFCQERLCYGALCKELSANNLSYMMKSTSEGDSSAFVDYIKLPVQPATRLLHKQLLSCSIRLQSKNKLLLVTFQFFIDELIAEHNTSNQVKSSVYLAYDYSQSARVQLKAMLVEIKNEWTSMGKLYSCLIKFLKDNKKREKDKERKFELRYFTFKKVILAYGPSLSYTVTIVWNHVDNRFVLHFGINGELSRNSNPHTLVYTELQCEFNQHNSIGTLIDTLNLTFDALSTIKKLKSIPLFGIISSRPQVPVEGFCLIPQSSTHIRILYRNVYCIDVLIQSDGNVAIRDGAYSLFDKSKALEELTPIQSLKTFLNKFVDKSSNQNATRQYPNEDDNPPSPVPQMEGQPADCNMSTSGYSINKSNINSPLPTMSDPNTSALSNALRGTTALHTSNPNTPASPHTSILSQTGYVPSPSIPEPSPGNLFPVNSPVSSIHAPSPSTLHPQPSPAPPNSNSSNFNISMPSPVSSGWPNSPSLSRPSPSRPVQSPAQPMVGQQLQVLNNSQSSLAPNMSRIMPGRCWAAAVPTVLTQNAFDIMCRPNAPVEPANLLSANRVYRTFSHLERFLGCVFTRKNMQRFIQSENTFGVVHKAEPGVTQFKNENFQFKVSLHPVTMQSLHIKIQLLPECQAQYNQEELEILERFFEMKIVCAPFKPNAFFAYVRLVNTPHKILKDCIQLMRLELYPDRSLKWTIDWCMTIPPASQVLGSPGMSAILFKTTNLLFFVQFNRNLQGMAGEPQSVVIPFLYDINRGVMQVPGKDPAFSNSPTFSIINQVLARCTEYLSSNEFPISFCVHEVMRNDIMPS